MNPANQRIMEQVIVGPDGQAYRRTTVNGTNPIAIGGYWDGEFIPEGDDTIPVQRFESLFRRAIPKQKPQSNQNIVKDQNPAGPMPDPSYFGTISSDPTINPIRRWIDSKVNNNPTLYRTRQGLRNFVQSAPGKVLDFFIPDVTSENGVMSAVAPVVSKIGFRVPTEASFNQRGRALIKAESDRLKAIEAATKEGRYYVEPKPSDFDIDKSYIFNSPDYTSILSKIRNIKITK